MFFSEVTQFVLSISTVVLLAIYAYTCYNATYMRIQPKANKVLHKFKTIPNFPGGAVFKNPPANVGDTGLIPGLGRAHMPWSN